MAGEAALEQIRATAELPRNRETPTRARRRGLADIALVSVMRDALLRRSEAAALCWRDFTALEDGSGRITVRRSKNDQEGKGAVLYLGTEATRDLSALRAVQQGPPERVFGLSPSQINRRLKAAALAAGLSSKVSGHSCRVGMAVDLAADGTELPALMTAGRWRSPEMPAAYARNELAGRGAVARYYRRKGYNGRKALLHHRGVR